MELYHTSDRIIKNPKIIYSRDYLDFGKGFYLTSMRDQAEKYGERFKRRNKESWINIYEFEIDESHWKILNLESYNEEWLRFISNCRGGNDFYNYDLVIGGIANDKVIKTLDRYFNGELNELEALGLLIYEKPNIQFCIRSQKMLDKCLKFRESILL